MKRNSIIFEVIQTIFKQSEKRNKIIDEGNKETSTHFALKSIIYSIVGALLIILTIFLFKNGLNSNNPLFLIGLVIIAFALAISSLLLFLISLITIINQLRLNRKAIGFIALALFFVLLAGSVFIAYTLI